MVSPGRFYLADPVLRDKVDARVGLPFQLGI